MSYNIHIDLISTVRAQMSATLITGGRSDNFEVLGAEIARHLLVQNKRDICIFDIHPAAGILAGFKNHIKE